MHYCPRVFVFFTIDSLYLVCISTKPRTQTTCQRSTNTCSTNYLPKPCSSMYFTKSHVIMGSLLSQRLDARRLLGTPNVNRADVCYEARELWTQQARHLSESQMNDIRTRHKLLEPRQNIDKVHQQPCLQGVPDFLAKLRPQCVK